MLSIAWHPARWPACCRRMVTLGSPAAQDRRGGAQQPTSRAARSNLILPDLAQVQFLGGIDGRTLLMGGLVVSLLGLLFGLVIYSRSSRTLPVHSSMLEISELIYETCKTYLITQGKFILILEVFIGVDHRRLLRRAAATSRRSRSRSSCCSAWSASPAATASPGSASASTPSPTRAPRSPASRASRIPIYAIPLKAGMSIGMLLICVELLLMLVHPALHPGRLRRPVLHRLRHRRVARRRGAAHRRRHLHQDRRHRLRPDEDRLQHQGRRRAQPGRHRRLHRRQRGRLGRPERRRLRDLRRHRRRAHHVHPARRARARPCRCSCSSGSS